MIKSITATNYLGQSVKIVLTEGDPDHGMIIESIDGLGPPKANVSLTDLAGLDGSVFNSAKVENRNIVINMLFTYAPSIEDSRQRTYKYFPIKKPVTLLIETDNRTAKISGIVESNEPDIFSETESNSISIVCPGSYFHSLGQDISIFGGTKKLFEFEFSNESLTENIIEMGSISDNADVTINYNGDAETGVIMTIIFLDQVDSDITIYNTHTRESMKISHSRIYDILNNLGYTTFLSKGTEIIINTNPGNKKIELLKDGAYVNILNAIDKESDWFQIKKGENTFAISAGMEVGKLEFSIENQILYEGV